MYLFMVIMGVLGSTDFPWVRLAEVFEHSWAPGTLTGAGSQWFSTCGSRPLRITYQISSISDLHNSSKMTVMKEQWNNFVVGGHPNMRSYIKGCGIRKVENHCPKEKLTL